MDTPSNQHLPASEQNVGALIISERSGDYQSNFVTPAIGRWDISPTVTQSPASFHTAESLDVDYQRIVNPDLMDSPLSSSPGMCQPLFYSDGRPRPPSDESRDSVDEGDDMPATLTNMTTNMTCLFEDPHQPKLLLADDPIEPTEDKRLLHDEFVPLPPPPETTIGIGMKRDHHHEALHNDHQNTRRRNRGREASHCGEDTPLLEQSQEERNDSWCCVLL